MHRSVATTILLLMHCIVALCQKKEVTGLVLDIDNQSPVSEAYISASVTGLSTFSDENGRFYIEVSYGESIIISRVGYQPSEIELSGDSGSVAYVVAHLARSGILDTITYRYSDSVQPLNIGTLPTTTLHNNTIEQKKFVLGSSDVFKSIQSLPGVVTGKEGSTSYYVRGGGSGQNMVYLDQAPIYYVNHLFGFASTINTDIIRYAKFIKGGFPAEYGNRTSSFLDLHSFNGNPNEVEGAIDLGLMATSINIQGPISKKEKISFFLSGRRSYSDLVAKAFYSEESEPFLTTYKFEDVFGRLDYKISEYSLLAASVLYTRDKYHIGSQSQSGDMNYAEQSINTWRNSVVNLSFQSKIGATSFLDLTAYNSSYYFKNDISINYSGDSGRIQWKGENVNSISDLGLKAKASTYINNQLYIKYGGELNFLVIVPNDESLTYEDFQGQVSLDTSRPSIAARRAGLFSSINFDSKGVRAEIGVRANYRFFNRSNLTVEPRVLVELKKKNKYLITLTGSRTTQNLQLVSSNGIGFPNELWIPSVNGLKSLNSNELSLTYTRILKLRSKMLTLSTGVFWRTYRNISRFRTLSASYSFGENIYDDMIQGRGNSYGLEFGGNISLTNKANIDINYTLSWANRQFEEINNGREFPFDFDRRHNLQINLAYSFTKNSSLSAGFTLYNGQKYTLPNEIIKQPQDDPTTSLFNQGRGILFGFNEINNSEYPLYHRFDVNWNFSPKLFNRKVSFDVGVYNIYGRQNPFYIPLDGIERAIETGYIEGVSIFPIVPHFSARYKFK